MVEPVKDRKLYQVTMTNSYKQAFVLGQKLVAGIEDNPFFKFYETIIEYDVTNGDTGQVFKVNAIEWLRQVRSGLIIPRQGALAEIAWSVSQHYMMLSRELLLEQIRLDEFGGEPPSRQRCLYLCETLEEARTWLPLIDGDGTICELTCSGKVHRADSRLMVKVSEPLSATREGGRAYWRGDVSGDPRMETLFEGEATVSAVGL